MIKVYLYRKNSPSKNKSKTSAILRIFKDIIPKLFKYSSSSSSDYFSDKLRYVPKFSSTNPQRQSFCVFLKILLKSLLTQTLAICTSCNREFHNSLVLYDHLLFRMCNVNHLWLFLFVELSQVQLYALI